MKWKPKNTLDRIIHLKEIDPEVFEFWVGSGMLVATLIGVGLGASAALAGQLIAAL